MHAQLSANYRLIGHSLYRKSGNAFMHVAIVPVNRRLLHQAIAWFEAQE
ncbi:hypothetical protein K32_48530 [Kaistia sp. 32K]|nr:hypothetical protein [Kaistia sp. 32K]BCP56236.1 hypothetical protein K32_48530 [Kaistia sp. 32K]